MKLNKLSNLTSQKTFFTFANNNKDEKISIKNNNVVTAPKLFAAYPPNFYISFKGAKDTPEYKNFEAFIDKFCNENMGKITDEPDFFEGACSTISPFVNKNFKDEFKYRVRNNPPQDLNEQQIFEILGKSLTLALCHIRNVNFTKDKNNYKQKIKQLTQELIEQHKKENNITSDLSLQVDYSEIRKIFDEHVENIVKQEFETDNSPRFRVTMNRYYDSLQNELKKYEKPIVNETLRASLKEILQKDQFKTFFLKMEKVHKQEKLNQNYTSDNCAKDLYEDLVNKGISPFENPKTYDFVSKNNEKLKFILEKIYGYEVPYIHRIFAESGIDEKHKVLFIDPCIYAHFEELSDYVKTQNIDTSKLEPFELRENFSKYLGTETVFRGLFGTEPEKLAEKLKKDGNFAQICQNKDNTIEAIKYYIDADKGNEFTIRGRISLKIQGSRSYKGNEFASVSTIYDIAASVPKNIFSPDIPVVVIEANIPKLNIIKQKGPFKTMQSHSIDKTLFIGNKRYNYNKEQEKIEAFVPFYIPTNNAKITLDKDTPTFYWSDIQY